MDSLQRPIDDKLVYIITPHADWYETLNRAFTQQGFHTAHFQNSDTFLYFMGLYKTDSNLAPSGALASDTKTRPEPKTIPGAVIAARDAPHHWPHVLEEFAGLSTHVPAHRLPQLGFRAKGVGVVLSHSDHSVAPKYVEYLAGEAVAQVPSIEGHTEADAERVVEAAQKAIVNAKAEKENGVVPKSAERGRT